MSINLFRLIGERRKKGTGVSHLKQKKASHQRKACCPSSSLRLLIPTHKRSQARKFQITPDRYESKSHGWVAVTKIGRIPGTRTLRLQISFKICQRCTLLQDYSHTLGTHRSEKKRAIVRLFQSCCASTSGWRKIIYGVLADENVQLNALNLCHKWSCRLMTVTFLSHKVNIGLIHFT